MEQNRLRVELRRSSKVSATYFECLQRSAVKGMEA